MKRATVAGWLVFLTGSAILWAEGPPPYVLPAPVPVVAQANTIAANPFPDEPGLAPTMVTVALENADLMDALEELGKQGSCAYDYVLNPKRKATPVTVALKNQPYMEALRQIAAQGSLQVEPIHAPLPPGFKQHVQAAEPGSPVSVWSIAGPFCFSVESIEHEVRLARINGELFTVNLMVDHEPKVRVMALPTGLKLLEIADEKGNSLLKPEGRYTNAPWNGSGFALQLAYPAKNAGKRIAVLKASGTFSVQTKSEMLEYADPAADKPASKEIGGMNVTLYAPTKSSSRGSIEEYSVRLVLERGTMAAADWKKLAAARQTIIPGVALEEGRQVWAEPSTVTAGDEKFERSFRYWVSVKTPMAVKKLSVVVPLEIKDVTVPIEFKDLPLP